LQIRITWRFFLYIHIPWLCLPCRYSNCMHLAQPLHDPSWASALLYSDNCSLNCCRGSCGRKGGGGGKGRTLRKGFLGGGRIPSFPINLEDAESFSLRSPPPPYLQSPGKNWRLRKRFENWFWNRRVGGRAQPLKEWQSPRTWHKLIKNQLGARWWISWLPVDFEPQYKLVVTHHHGQLHTHRHHESSKAHQKDKKWAVAQFLEIPTLPQNSWNIPRTHSVQFTSVTLCDPMDCSTPAFPVHHIRLWNSIQFSHSDVSNSLWPKGHRTAGLPVHHQLLELTQTHVHRVWWCHPTISSYVVPSPPTFSFSQHQGLFQWVGSLHLVAKVLELQHQSFQWIFRTDFL